MIYSKIIIISLMTISIITILNISNLCTNQIVHAQIVIDTLNVGIILLQLNLIHLDGKMYVINRK